MSKIILTSSFNTVAKKLFAKTDLLNKCRNVTFIPTAANVYQDKPWMEADRKALVDLGLTVQDVDLVGATPDSLKSNLQKADMIFVAGGNTTYLCEQVYTSGFMEAVKDLLRKDKIYIGSSAGSIIAGPTVEPFIAEDILELPKDFVLHDASCLNLVDYIVLPHYPDFAKENAEILEKYSGKYHFIKMTDDEYKVESWPA